MPHEGNRAQEYLDIAEVILLALDVEGRITLINRKGCSVLGWQESELLGRDWFDTCLPARIRNALRTKFQEILNEDCSLLENPVLTKSGQERMIAWRNSLLRDETGRVTGTLSSGEDITERRQAEEALRSSQKMLATIFDSFPDAIVLTTRQGCIARINEQGGKIFGYSREELLGQPIELLIPELIYNADTADWQDSYRDPRARPMGAGLELLGRRKDSTEFPVDILLSQIETEEGHLVLTVVRDITERKHAEQAIARLVAIVEYSDDAIIGKTLDGIIQSWNAAAERLYGYSAPEVVGRPISILGPSDRTDEVPKILERLKKGQFIEEYETQRIKKDGRRVDVFLTVSPIRDAKGNLIGASTIARDITERKHAEEALRTSEARLRLSASASNVGLWDWDLATNEAYFSPEWKKQIGYSEEEIPGRFEEWQNRVHPDDLEPTLQKIHAFLENPQGRHKAEFRFRHKDGSYRWIETQADMLRDAAGKPSRMLGCHIDITERKQAEERLRRSEAYLAKGQQLSHTGSWAWKVSSGEFYWSDETFRIFGFDPAQTTATLGETFLQRVHPEDRLRVELGIKESLINPKDSVVDYRIVLPNGSIKYLRDVVYPVTDETGQVVERYGLVLDITERKRAEDVLRELSGQLLRSQDEERRRLARELHDSTGQKLSALAMNLGVVDQLARGLDPRAQRALAQSLALTEDSLRELRTLAHLLHPPELDELGLAEAVQHYVNGFVERSRILVDLEVSPDLGRLPQDVETALFRILQESLTNIHRHSDSSKAWVHIIRSPADVTMKVEDEGRGMQERVSHHDGKRPLKLGVGIAGMRERVSQLGGEWKIRSTSKGTTLTAVIPLK